MLRRSVKEWNEWRRANDFVALDLSKDNLSRLDLYEVNFCQCNLTGAQLNDANLSHAILIGATLTNAQLSRSNLSYAVLNYANLNFADLSNVNLSHAQLRDCKIYHAQLNDANLSHCFLYGATVARSNVTNTVWTGVSMGLTVLADLDLHAAIDLDTTRHLAPSTIGVDTILQSNRILPDKFLRGVGLSDNLIDYYRSLVSNPIDFYSCFISYSTKDQAFADRLHADLQAKGVRCWFAPHDLKAGQKLHEQIDEAIRLHEKLLLILSPNSMGSEWVRTEISKARKRERKENRRVLFPIRLVDFSTLRDWECFDADAGKDSAREIREYYIPDFSHWRTDADAYETEFAKLLQSLKSETK